MYLRFNLTGILVCLLPFSILAQKIELKSPQGKTQLVVENKSGQLFYSVFRNNVPIINESKLGLVLKDLPRFDENFEIISTEKTSVNQNWEPVWGELKTIEDKHEQLYLKLKQKDKQARLLDIIFRVFDEGVAFRYSFPRQPNLRYFIVEEEVTEFALTGNHKTFWIPADYDSNEFQYNTTLLSEIDAHKAKNATQEMFALAGTDQNGVQTPLMLKSANGMYINIHEAALANYPAMQIHVDKENYKLHSRLVPDALNNKAYLHAPCVTPWRTIIASDKATEVLASKMILNLNDSSKIENTEWIKPMKFVGVWWEYQTGKSTWSYAESADAIDAQGNLTASGKHGANNENVKRYIDFAAKNGIQGVLVEGWNVGWEDWFGNWKEDVFDFVTPYPDFNVEELNNYAKSKGVNLIMHHETSASALNYERHLDTAFTFMNKYGYPAVKTGYVGKIIPRGEHHDGQWMVNHYERVVKKAAQHKVMVNSHESVRPTGLQRTYPNWLAAEAARGNEYNAFSIGNQPEHETILPFTRLMGGPMDYTPGIFKLKGYADYAPERQVHTTLAKQLALYVTIYSPIQMVADQVENYALYPDAFQFIKDVAVDWDDTKIIEAEPGDYLTIARKAKGKQEWFIGSITDENTRISQIPLNFLAKGKDYLATIYRDAGDADWKNNPEAYKIEQFKVDTKTLLRLRLAAGGGTAISIIPFEKGKDNHIRKYK